MNKLNQFLWYGPMPWAPPPTLKIFSMTFTDDRKISNHNLTRGSKTPIFTIKYDIGLCINSIISLVITQGTNCTIFKFYINLHGGWKREYSRKYFR